MEHDLSLENVGWKVLRERQVNLEKLIRRGIRIARETAGRVQLLDLALGSGRQILEILRSLPDLDIAATLQDADQGNLDKGQQLANQLGVTKARFRIGDAFDMRALTSLDPAPNVVLATGLYELTPDNRRVLDSLFGLAHGVQRGGLLVYTDQPHHPHLEMIGRVAVQREESPWAMKRRTVEEMDSLIEEAGFSLLERTVDEHGLFCVGLAQRL